VHQVLCKIWRQARETYEMLKSESVEEILCCTKTFIKFTQFKMMTDAMTVHHHHTVMKQSFVLITQFIMIGSQVFYLDIMKHLKD
jgi:hypothetical protein